VNDAREEIAQAIERVRGEDGVLLLTDMFGGTPSNLGMTFLETDRVEVITGVNLPMLIKLAGSRSSSDLLAVAREMRDHGRNAIWVASDSAAGREEPAMTSRSVTVVNQLGMHARAAAKFVHLATRFQRRSAWRATRARWTARASWAFCCWRAARGRRSRSAPRARRTERWTALTRSCDRDSARTYATPDRHRRLAGSCRGRAVILIQRAQVLRYQIAPARLEHELARLERAARAARSSCRTSAPRRARRGPDMASLFDAQLLMLDDPMVVPRAARSSASSASTPSGPCSRCSTSSAPSSTRWPIRTARAQGDVADLVGGCA
jgi:hypothetical protein